MLISIKYFVVSKIIYFFALLKLEFINYVKLCIMDEEVKLKEPYETFDGIPNIVSFCCVLGLKFPDTATDFQKASLTLAHLMASIRDYVLAGREIPSYTLDVIDSLHYIMQINCDVQR